MRMQRTTPCQQLCGGGRAMAPVSCTRTAGMRVPGQAELRQCNANATMLRLEQCGRSRAVRRVVVAKSSNPKDREQLAAELERLLPEPGTGAPPAQAATPVQASSVLAPGATYESIAKVGLERAGWPTWRLLVQGMQAGAYISFGGVLMLAVGGNMPGLFASNPGLHKLICALLYPIGLQMVLLGGADLFTGNAMIAPVSHWRGHINAGQLARSWGLSYLGNMLGSFAMVAMVAYAGVLAGNPMAIRLAEAKTSVAFGPAVVRAMLANWLVCIAVYQGCAATSLPGKVLGLWPPVTAFVAMGLEHCVANMFLVPMGMVLGANVTQAQWWLGNLVPVTIGNVLGGVLFMAYLYTVCFRPRDADAKPAAA